MHKLSVFLQAKSVAVIGASSNPLKVGHQIFRNLVKNNGSYPHAKKLYPINPHITSLLNHPAFGSVTDVKEEIAVVIIVTPAETISSLIDEIILRNKVVTKIKPIKGIVIISAGFAETSKAGQKIQLDVSQKLRDAKIVLLGPNSLGLLSPINHLNASFAQREIPEGNIALISQSGAMLTALFDVIVTSNLGISFSVSLGNKADLNENDCLEYAATDPNTRVVALYLESFADLQEFFELVSRISKKKPVIVLKGGTSERGQAASLSHTAALATNQILLNAAAEQMGFVLVNTIEELLNTVFFMSRHQYLIQNSVIITNAGGPAVNTIDRLAEENVALSQWSKTSLDDFERLIPNIPVHNPFDLLGDASPERYKFAIQVAQRDPNIDSMLVIVTPQAVTDMPAIVKQIIILKGKKPILVSLMGGDHLDKFRRQLRAAGITCTAFPNDLVNILHYTRQITDFHFEKRRFISSPAHHKDKVKQEIHTIGKVFKMLKEHGFEIPQYYIITKEHFTDLRKLKYPLFVKTANLSVIHKKQVGAIAGKVDSYTPAALAFHKMLKFGNEVLFQELIDLDTELLMGIENDSQFGLYLTIGLGGSYSNIIADRAYIFLPAIKDELKKAWRGTKAYQILKRADLDDEIVENMLRLQKVVMRNTWIKSIEVNPLVVNARGTWVADIKVTAFSTDSVGEAL